MMFVERKFCVEFDRPTALEALIVVAPLETDKLFLVGDADWSLISLVKLSGF